MLTKNKIKLIKSLEQKKYRLKHNCFIVEGEKMVNELIESNYKILNLFHTCDFDTNAKNIESFTISQNELDKISMQKNANKALAIVEIPTEFPKHNHRGIALVLDGVQDPGNLGTIIRTANWFGIKQIFCSEGSADVYNPKVVQSTMGAIFRTQVVYCNIEELITDAKNKKIPVYGTLLSGTSIYSHKLSDSGLIVLGNESKGISKSIESLIDYKLKIPNYSEQTAYMESLNVAIANAIVLAEFKRQIE